MNDHKEPEKKLIDLREIINKRNPTLLKWIPSFVLRFIEKAIHQEDVNQLIINGEGSKGIDFVNNLIEKQLKIEVEVIGEENIPKEGGVIFASNHPLGGLDGIVFMYVVGKIRKDVKFLVNDLLLNIKPLDPLFVPVNTLGPNGRKNLRLIEEAYADEHALLVFPAGLVSRKIDGKIQDLAWKKSFISKSKKYKKNVIPVHINGENSSFFYNLARVRQKLGIKTNFEMFFLPNELFAQKNKKVVIRIGKPVSYEEFDKNQSEQYWADEIKAKVYNLGKLGNE